MTILQEPASIARRAMIDSQLRVSGVNDPAVLAAIEAVAREDFVPPAQRDHAYIDRALPLGQGQALPAPLFHGLVLSEAQVQPQDRVLVVSPAGYLAALVAQFGAAVTTISPAEVAGPAADGAEQATLILIDGAIEALPDSLAARLAEGGRIVTGVAERQVTRLAVGTKSAGAVSLLPVADLGIPVLAEFTSPPAWSF